jgi:pimeloyl-ACP methyl ester carboxylesterase
MVDHPILLVHGLASSFEHNWRATGWTDILADEGRTVLGVDLPGHGTSGAQDPAGLSPATAVLGAPGGHALLAAAAEAPERFRRIAVLGVGDQDPAGTPNGPVLSVIAGLESDTEPDDQTARVIRRLAVSAGNDRHAVAGYLRAPHPAVKVADLARIDLPVLVVLGDRDFAGPADGLLAALPDARLATLAGVDHFGTPSDFRCIEAVTRFLGQ